MKTLQGQITISRVTSNEGDYIQIVVKDKLSGQSAVEARMSIENFGQAISGLACVDCEFEWRPEKIGLKREQKTELVDCTPTDREHLRKMAMADFEVDGWMGRLEDTRNGHKRHGAKQAVTFVRFVEPQPPVAVEGE